MFIVDRLSVTPENIVVHNKRNRGTLNNIVPWMPWYLLHSYSYSELLHSKELIGKGNKKGIALINFFNKYLFA
jgi:hypothetical protein